MSQENLFKTIFPEVTWYKRIELKPGGMLDEIIPNAETSFLVFNILAGMSWELREANDEDCNLVDESPAGLIFDGRNYQEKVRFDFCNKGRKPMTLMILAIKKP
ncbi:MAG: hypothetical protein KAQ63_00605 [Candidatus Moranbacteria bacterium]|nr:hypothetical protein [Candidatus Moranbacteria bacterium]